MSNWEISFLKKHLPPPQEDEACLSIFINITFIYCEEENPIPTRVETLVRMYLFDVFYEISKCFIFFAREKISFLSSST